MEQTRVPLLEAVDRLIDTKPAYFRIPGHRLERGICEDWTRKTGTGIFAYDVTETPFTDDLHCPEGAIMEAQELLSRLYGADRSFFLVNGTTCGNEAMIMSAAFAGQKIMIARNAHKSAMMGLVLSGAEPVYVMPDVLSDWGIQGGISPLMVRRTFEKNPDCKALFLVSPSYYGVASNLKEIANICHEFGALLLVDEAHGGHLYFSSRLPVGALEAGADMCVQSMHKVTGALTQSSVLHIKRHAGTELDVERVVSSLQLVQSTSPSYLLMISLDCARKELAVNGKKMMSSALELAEYARNEIRKIDGFRCMGEEVTGVSQIDGVDLTRLVISAKDIGLTGFELDALLFEKYDVNMELSDYENALAIVTYANTRDDMDRLIEACRMISMEKVRGIGGHGYNKKNDIYVTNMPLPPVPEQALTPREAYFSETEEIEWGKAAGRIAAQPIAPYPPGIPIVCAGERISAEAWEYIESFRRDGRHIHGGVNGKLDMVKVIADKVNV